MVLDEAVYRHVRAAGLLLAPVHVTKRCKNPCTQSKERRGANRFGQIGKGDKFRATREIFLSLEEDGVLAGGWGWRGRG